MYTSNELKPKILLMRKLEYVTEMFYMSNSWFVTNPLQEFLINSYNNASFRMLHIFCSPSNPSASPEKGFLLYPKPQIATMAMIFFFKFYSIETVCASFILLYTMLCFVFRSELACGLWFMYERRVSYLYVDPDMEIHYE